jgi:hypothetical protein
MEASKNLSNDPKNVQYISLIYVIFENIEITKQGNGYRLGLICNKGVESLPTMVVKRRVSVMLTIFKYILK